MCILHIDITIVSSSETFRFFLYIKFIFAMGKICLLEKIWEIGIWLIAHSAATQKQSSQHELK
jgi:hypothetical protein